MAIWADNTEDLMHKYMYNTDESGYMKVTNAYFRGNSLYSYTTEVARKYPEQKIIIITRYKYSTSTQIQLYHLRHAIDNTIWTVMYADCFELDKLKDHYIDTLNAYRGNDYNKLKNGALKCAEDRRAVRNIWTNYISYLNIMCPDEESDKDLLEFVNKQIDYDVYRKNLAEERYKKQVAEKLKKQRTHFDLVYDIYNKHVEDIKACLDSNGFKYTWNIYMENIYKEYCSEATEGLYFSRYSIKDIIKLLLIGMEKEKVFNMLYVDLSYNYSRARDIMYLENAQELHTDRFVTINLTSTMRKYLHHMIDLYKTGKYSDMVNKHISCYVVGYADAERLCVGCHTFSPEAIDMIEKELNFFKE